ncbi:hypothetical protein BY996DRAFT_6641386, partial [Phakopsora pachyrhizi]
MSIERTIGLDGIRVKEPFLKQSLKLIKKQFISQSRLGIRVCMRGYQLFFSTNAFEYLIGIKKETNKLSIEGTNNMKVKKKRKKKAGEDKGKEDIFLYHQTQKALGSQNSPPMINHTNRDKDDVGRHTDSSTLPGWLSPIARAVALFC